ncbi:MAG TPA: hypothetical protein VLT36_11820, partial [Candidatus Dormibacteraeota bacterium]|nr:hypothetical protein [Candidatus Dormibacteraeota bacterium]
MDQVAREQDLASDSLFKWIVVSSSALAMGVTLGLLGGLIIDRDTGLSLHWHWSIVLWAAAGVSATIYVWKTVWAAGKDENPA